MEHKTWLWKKKSSEKVILASDHSNVSPSLKEQEQEIQNLRSENTELENQLKSLNDELSSALLECDNKEEQAKNNANMAHDANAGWEKAKTELVSLRQELDTALQQSLIGDERISQLDAALKECMQQLRFVRDEQEKRIHDAVTKATKEFEKSKTIFEENLTEKSQILAKIYDENTLLSKALLAKENSVEDLSKQKTKLEENLTTLASRLESSEKDNASFKYEVRVLEKEIQIWNEEREFSRRSSDASHKQHLENSKKIAKLESECQRLRILVRKRLPGPAALAKMKDEVDILDMRRRRSSSSPDRLPVNTSMANSVNFLTEQLCGLAEENKNLKEALSKEINELQFSRTLYSHAASKISEIESQVEESPQNVKRELFVSSMSDTCSDDKAESRASALISKLENLKSGNLSTPSCETTRVSDISLMDDFLEMEKFAIVSEENSCESVTFSVSGSSESGSSGNSSDGKGTEIVPFVENDGLVPADAAKHKDNSMESDTLPEVTNFETSLTENSVPSDLRKSVCKIIELIEGISLPSADCNETSETYRVFQWKTTELGPVSQQVTQTCYDLLNGKADMNRFTEEISSALEWIVNHCFSLQDVSSMKEENEQLKCELLNLEAKRQDLEESLQSAVDKSEHLSNQLEDSEKTVERLLKELETSKENNGEDQDKSRIEDIEAKLSVALAELNEACQKLSLVEAELENKSSCYGELEAKCLDLQLQLESLTNRETSIELKQEENLPRSDLEINAASEKLAECQESILNLGKQLKALASLRDASLFDKVVSDPTTPTSTTPVTPGSPKNKLTHLGSSLLYQMIAEDDETPKAKESDNSSSSGFVINGAKRSDKDKDVAVNSWAIVPRKKAKNVSLWRKLLLRKRKSISSKTTLPFTK